jgi:hypothetical protein
MKTHNEYSDKLVNIGTAYLAHELGYPDQSPECFAIEQYETKDGKILPGIISDEWSGLIPEGFNYYCSRPSIYALQSWLRNEHQINVFVGFRPNVKKWDSHAYNMKLSGKDYARLHKLDKFRSQPTYDDYEIALEVGIYHGLEMLKENIIK